MADRPGSPSGRGLHFTTDGTIVDVWHWMAVRTNPMGQLEELDAQYPIETVVPSVVHRGPMEGDRADVKAMGTLAAGRRRLEAMRELDTGSTTVRPMPESWSSP